MKLWNKIRNEWQHPEEREIVFPTILALEVIIWLCAPILRWHIQDDNPEAPSFFAQATEAGLALAMALVLFAASWAYSPSRNFTKVVLALFLICVGLLLINLFFLPGHGVLLLAHVPLVPLIFLSCFALLRYLVRAKRVSKGTLSGAVLCYLLLSMMFTQLFFFAWWIEPALLAGIPEWTAELGKTKMDFAIENGLLNKLQYFSMTTFTTLGYGDISPQTPMGQALATAEAATGQIYVGIVIAKLVSLYMREGTSNRRDRED